MLYQMKEEDVSKILEYLGNDVENCIYMYIDISIYKTTNPYMKVWYEMQSDELSMVIMKYHNSFQVYSHLEHPNVEVLWEYMRKYDIAMISAKDEIIKMLEPISRDLYLSTFGDILQLTKFYPLHCEDIRIEEANESDAAEIAELICADEYYQDAYTVPELNSQLVDRMRTKMGRSFIIRDKGKIVAHNSISAETEDVAVAAMLLVDKAYRHTLYGLALEEFIVNKLNEEGKKLFGFSTNKKRKKQFEMMGNKVVATYGKLIKK